MRAIENVLFIVLYENSEAFSAIEPNQRKWRSDCVCTVSCSNNRTQHLGLDGFIHHNRLVRSIIFSFHILSSFQGAVLPRRQNRFQCGFFFFLLFLPHTKHKMMCARVPVTPSRFESFYGLVGAASRRKRLRPDVSCTNTGRKKETI